MQEHGWQEGRAEADAQRALDDHARAGAEPGELDVDTEAELGHLDVLSQEVAEEQVDMEREARRSFLIGRQRGVGSSDIHRVLTGQAHEVYLEKTRPITDEDVDEGRDKIDLMRGNLLEPIAAALFWKVTGREGRREKRQFFHPDYPGAMTSADGTQYGNSPNLPPFAEGTGGLELKNPRASVVQDLIEHGTRESIILQLQHSIAVRRLSWGSYGFCTLEHSAGPIVPVDVAADRAVGGFLLEISARFWVEHVVPRVPPNSEEWAKLLDKAPPIRETSGTLVVLDEDKYEDAAGLLRRFIEASKVRKEIEDARDGLSMELDRWLREHFPEHAKFQVPGVGKLTRVTQQRSTFDRALLSMHRPIDRDAFIRMVRACEGMLPLDGPETLEALADSITLDLKHFENPGEPFSFLKATPAREAS